MDLIFTCAICSARLRIDDPLAGRRVRCRACGKVVIAPLAGDDPGFRIVEREPDPEILHTLLSKKPAGRGPGRKIAVAAGTVVILAAVGFAVWDRLSASALPELVRELPDGDYVIFRTQRGASFFTPETAEFADAREIATLHRGTETLHAYRGEFKPATLGENLISRGYAPETVEGERIYVYPRADDAVWVSRKRILSGTRALVVDALAASRGRSKTFAGGLTTAQRRTLERLPAGDWMYLSKSPQAAERVRLGATTRGLLTFAPTGSQGVGLSLRWTSEGEASAVYAVGDEDERLRVGLAVFEEWFDECRLANSGRISLAIGRLRRAKIDCRENETEAAAGLRALVRAEEDFRESDRDGNGVKDYWTKDAAGLVRELAGVHKGYRFLAMKYGPLGEAYWTDTSDRHPAAFAFCAVPERHGTTGELTMIVNEGGEIYRKDTKGEPVRAWPADPQGQGWRRVP